MLLSSWLSLCNSGWPGAHSCLAALVSHVGIKGTCHRHQSKTCFPTTFLEALCYIIYDRCHAHTFTCCCCFRVCGLDVSGTPYTHVRLWLPLGVVSDVGGALAMRGREVTLKGACKDMLFLPWCKDASCRHHLSPREQDHSRWNLLVS